MFGIQAWVALPAAVEEAEPDFAHHEDATLPVIEDHGVRMRVIAGSMYGQRSPVPTFSETIYADAALSPGARLPVDPSHEERAVYVAEGEVQIAGDRFAGGRLLVFRPGDAVQVVATTDARVLVLGGEPLDGPRHIWWNFVSSRKERIEQAKADWRAGRFDAVPGDIEFIPLPD